MTEEGRDDQLDEAADVFGLVLEAEPPERAPVVYLWPEDVEGWHFFLACRTQWRSGFDGPTGLDYAGVECLMRQHRIGPRRQRKLWPLVRSAEIGYLQGIIESREENRKKAERERG